MLRKLEQLLQLSPGQVMPSNSKRFFLITERLSEQGSFFYAMRLLVGFAFAKGNIKPKPYFANHCINNYMVTYNC